MRLPISCMKCFQEYGKPPFDFSRVEFVDNGRYEVTCPNGHTTVTIVQAQKFEVLFDIGAYAIKDGYYREAVSSFTSSLERFYEFFIQVMLFEKNINKDKFNECWKLVSNQSERQLGAFIFMYLEQFGKKPDLLSNSKIQFRNEVIHKGKIPKKEQALGYGQAVLDIVRPLLILLKSDFSESVHQTVHNHLMNCRQDSDNKQPVSTMAISTIISISNGEPSHDKQTLIEAIENLRKW